MAPSINPAKLVAAGVWASLLASCVHATNAGQRVIYSYPGPTPPDSLYDLTRQGKVGGIILFGENIGKDTATVVSALQKAYAASPGADKEAKLLVMTDQEGGTVRRIPDAGPYLSAKRMGQSEDPGAVAQKGGTEAAAALKPDGINANLAPVVDVYRKEGNFIDETERSFGNTSERVNACAGPFTSAQQGAGVLATAKHFPGLGAAPAGSNTDEGSVTIELSVKELRSADEMAYKAALEAGVGMVMASWAIYPALDSKPAGLSSKWVQGELRRRLGFKGVIITDALEAKSLEDFGDTSERTVLAAKAGMDLLLASGRNVTQGEIATDALAKALSNGHLAKDEFTAATDRVFALRRKLK